MVGTVAFAAGGAFREAETSSSGSNSTGITNNTNTADDPVDPELADAHRQAAALLREILAFMERRQRQEEENEEETPSRRQPRRVIHHLERKVCDALGKDIQLLSQGSDDLYVEEDWAIGELKKEYQHLCTDRVGLTVEDLRAHISLLRSVEEVLVYHEEMAKNFPDRPRPTAGEVRQKAIEARKWNGKKPTKAEEAGATALWGGPIPDPDDFETAEEVDAEAAREARRNAPPARPKRALWWPRVWRSTEEPENWAEMDRDPETLPERAGQV